MNRTQTQRTANPHSSAPQPAMDSMTMGLSNRSATKAPSQRPTWEATHAQAGVSSHPTTTSRCASHLGTVPYPLRASAIKAKRTSVAANPAPAAMGMSSRPPSPSPRPAPNPAPTGEMASERIDVSPPRAARPAVTIAPIQARNVPSIHQTGRYHQVLPPPTASQVQGYALNGRSRMMSIAMNTTVPHSPMAAALAMPCTVREPARDAGKNAAATPPARTMSINASDVVMPAGRSREARRKRITATAVAAPTSVPLRRMWRNSDRSAVAIEVIDGLKKVVDVESTHYVAKTNRTVRSVTAHAANA